jgi:superfamily II DNA or RNA helicase
MFDGNGFSRLNDRGKILAIQRSRVVAGARQKIDELRNQIEDMKYDSHILVYCGAANLYAESYSDNEIEDEDIRQIDAVTQILGNSLGMKVSQFTSREDIDERSVLIKEFTEGRNLQALIAIKCLDEGVNIPKIKAAFILASSTNPKEYIQRRGRVLRLAEGKPYAVIYDFVTLPRNLGDSGSLTDEELIKDYSLIRNEITRVEEFSRLSMNPMDSKVLIQKILDAYRINRNDLNNTVGEVEFVD